MASKARREDQEEQMRISRTVVEQALNGKQAILTADAAADERFNMAQSIADFQIRSLICAPLIDSDGEAHGAIQIDTLNQLSRFNDQDLQILAGVASQAAIAMDNAKLHEDAVKQEALKRDLEVAKQMQHALLPNSSPQVYRAIISSSIIRLRIRWGVTITTTSYAAERSLCCGCWRRSREGRICSHSHG